MRGVYRRTVFLLVGSMVVLPLAATTLAPLTLADLTQRAQTIVRGLVLSAEPGSVEVGGTTLPTVTYRVRVEEGFKGDFTVKGDASEVEFTMLGRMKNEEMEQGTIRKLSSIPELPRLTVNEHYLLFVTQPSAIGLSTTVGLGTGCFELSGEGDKALVTNGFDNAGVFRGLAGMPSSGPVSYASLAGEIHAILGN